MIGSNVAVDASIIHKVLIQTLKQIAMQVEYTQKGAQMVRAKYVRDTETWKKCTNIQNKTNPLAFTVRAPLLVCSIQIRQKIRVLSQNNNHNNDSYCVSREGSM